MSTGSEHYREAEKYLAYADEAGERHPGDERAHLAYAQVHATLACAPPETGGLSVERAASVRQQLKDLRRRSIGVEAYQVLTTAIAVLDAATGRTSGVTP